MPTDLITDDIAELLRLADAKRIAIPRDDIQGRIARVRCILADGRVKQVVGTHGAYVDTEGNRASSLAGLMLQINKCIKAAYGTARAEMPRRMAEHAALLLDDIAHIIVHGEARGLPRPAIKESIYYAISRSGEDYAARLELVA